MRQNSTPAKILIRGTNWVGDAVMTLPAVAAVADHFSKAEITVLTRPWAAGVYQGQAGVKNVLADEKSGLGGRLRLAKMLRGQRFDLAILFQNAFGAALTSAMAGIPRRWGYARDGRRLLLSRPVEVTGADTQVHEVFYYLGLLERLGLYAPYRAPRLAVNAEAKTLAENMLREEGLPPGEKPLLIAPGAAFGSAKRWPVEYFAETARLILKERPGWTVIVGGQGEKSAADDLAALLPGPVLNLAGRTSLMLAMAVIEKGALMLTNDSGLMHIAGALNVPLVAAFGPTNPRTTAPLGPSRLIRSKAHCSPCLKRECPLPRQICWDDVTPDSAFKAALELLNPPPLKPGHSPAVFLDRDGTINREVEYLARPEQLDLIKGSGPAVSALNRAGYKVVVATNQSGLARGFFTDADLEKIHLRLVELLAIDGARLDGVYFCPHHPEGTVAEYARSCRCRKPESGLFERAAKDLKIDLAHSVWVGDRIRDIAAAEKFGGRSVLVTTGYGLTEVSQPLDFQPTVVAPDLRRAVGWIVNS
ncbi:lipopolysaccharide heptosyltransferase II [Deltaproteobacteria bacterium OttesenSCG-928-K17]|nr:lipopolysaccharide heptosyltransferase II [Deltaproteobacteria bacterium OttesenSCG-928-K17]